MIIDNQLNQQLTLGMMLSHNDAAIQGIAKLDIDCFSTIQNRLLYEIITDIVNVGKPPTIYAVNDELKVRGQILSLDDITNIHDKFYIPEAFESLITGLVDVSTRRKNITILELVQKNLKEDNKPIKDIMGSLSSLVSAFQNEKVMNSSNYIEQRKEHDNHKVSIKPVESGFESLDELLTYKFSGGEISIVGARPNNGKSVFKTNFTMNVCRNQPEYAVASYALEQTLMVESDRLEAMVSGIPSKEIAQNNFWLKDDSRWDKLNAARKEIEGWNYHLIEGTGKPSIEIISEIRQMVIQNNLKIVFFDLFDRIKEISNAMGDKPAMIGKILNQFLVLAKELDVHICLIVQINRENTKKKNFHGIRKRPELHELKGAGAYEEFARTILLLHYEGAYDTGVVKPIMEVIIGKQNNGPIAKLDFLFNTDTLLLTAPINKQGLQMGALNNEHTN